MRSCFTAVFIRCKMLKRWDTEVLVNEEQHSKHDNELINALEHNRSFHVSCDEIIVSSVWLSIQQFFLRVISS